MLHEASKPGWFSAYSGTKQCRRREYVRALICAACRTARALKCPVVGISVISRPPAIMEGGCHVASFLAATGILKCMHNQARHVNTTRIYLCSAIWL